MQKLGNVKLALIFFFVMANKIFAGEPAASEEVRPKTSIAYFYVVQYPFYPEIGDEVILTLEKTQPGLTTISYQWQKDNVNIPFATSDTLVIPDLQYSDEGYYRAILDDGTKAIFPSKSIYVNVYPAGSVPASNSWGLLVLAAILSLFGGVAVLYRRKGASSAA